VLKHSEKFIQDEIRLALSPYGVILRLNSGKAYGGNRVWDPRRNNYILTDIRPIALCPKGTSDLLFIGQNGQVAFIECKDYKGKPREDQQRFIEMMRSYGYRAGIARSTEDALKIIGVDDS
jgi:hypothetical protein